MGPKSPYAVYRVNCYQTFVHSSSYYPRQHVGCLGTVCNDCVSLFLCIRYRLHLADRDVMGHALDDTRTDVDDCHLSRHWFDMLGKPAFVHLDFFCRVVERNQ